MNKLQQQLHDLMLEILSFKEFRNGDVVIIKEFGPKGEELPDYLCDCEIIGDSILLKEINEEIHVLQARWWTLSDLLLAVKKRHYISKKPQLENMFGTYAFSTSLIGMKLIGIIELLDLTKALLNQEHLQQMIEILQKEEKKKNG